MVKNAKEYGSHLDGLGGPAAGKPAEGRPRSALTSLWAFLGPPALTWEACCSRARALGHAEACGLLAALGNTRFPLWTSVFFIYTMRGLVVSLPRVER